MKKRAKISDREKNIVKRVFEEMHGLNIFNVKTDAEIEKQVEERLPVKMITTIELKNNLVSGIAEVLEDPNTYPNDHKLMVRVLFKINGQKFERLTHVSVFNMRSFGSLEIERFFAEEVKKIVSELLVGQFAMTDQHLFSIKNQLDMSFNTSKNRQQHLKQLNFR